VEYRGVNEGNKEKKCISVREQQGKSIVLEQTMMYIHSSESQYDWNKKEKDARGIGNSDHVKLHRLY
jgi:hypothetical protein